MAEGGRLELATPLRRIDGSIPDPRPARPAITSRRVYACTVCGGHGTEPTHRPDHHPAVYAARIWAKPAVVAARAYLAQVDAAYEPCEFPRPLADHLRAVLAEIDKEAIG